MDNDEEIERKIKEAQKQKMKCRKCSWLNYDFFNRREEPYEEAEYWFCGLHGRQHIDPDGEQMNLDARGSCGFYPKIKPPKPPKQLSLFDF